MSDTKKMSEELAEEVADSLAKAIIGAIGEVSDNALANDKVLFDLISLALSGMELQQKKVARLEQRIMQLEQVRRDEVQ